MLYIYHAMHNSQWNKKDVVNTTNHRFLTKNRMFAVTQAFPNVTWSTIFLLPLSTFDFFVFFVLVLFFEEEEEGAELTSLNQTAKASFFLLFRFGFESESTLKSGVNGWTWMDGVHLAGLLIMVSFCFIDWGEQRFCLGLLSGSLLLLDCCFTYGQHFSM